MSDGLVSLIHDSIKNGKLKRTLAYSQISAEDGLRLISGSAANFIQGIEGSKSANYYGYFFSVDGLYFYFESKTKLFLSKEKGSVTVNRIELPY